MMNRKIKTLIAISIFMLTSGVLFAQNRNNPVFEDIPYWQDYSIKFYNQNESEQLLSAGSDRNGNIQLLSSAGLKKTFNGQFLYPGTIVADKSYRTISHKNIVASKSYKNQFVYLDEEAVFSNAWAGKLLVRHGMKNARIFEGGNDFDFLVSDGKNLKYFINSKEVWKGKNAEEIIKIRYTEDNDLFWILSSKSLTTFSPSSKKLEKVFEGTDFTSFDVVAFGTKTILGTNNGYIEINNISKKQIGEINRKLPVTAITVVEEVDGFVWFGSTQGAFMLCADGKYNYYYGERWLPGNEVRDITEGPDHSVLITTNKGLGQICFKQITLADKAAYFDTQVRERHIRNGFNASLNGVEHGNLSTGYLRDSDNDGLWTSMYLGAEIYRYSVTKSEEALQNCIESLDAMERLYSINPVEGFPSRSFERRGYIEELADPDRWQHAEDPEWDWKATTSSDEAIGHIFVMGAFAELIDVEPYRTRAVKIIDQLMQHIVDNDWYLVDYNGKPTTWGRWNPEYVNAFPINVGDRKLNSSNIVAMLQTAYHFTKKEIYKEKAFELMTEQGYLENLMRPMSEIGKAPENADDWSRMLSEGWNHSDDEMYFLGYWGLYRYAFNDELKAMYKEAILDHWEAERPEKDGLWNLITALVTNNFDLENAAWYLQKYPMDLITWDIKNSHRKDIELLDPNFRNQTTAEVLPPDEMPIQRHNGNTFRLDKMGSNGNSEYSAGDIWLLPYWLGRYLGVISEPVQN
ncbi:hypothetical protein OU798_22910 [Prolixibacteraceae bacterium Z1-6]|uniref:Two component regulator propeller n=1 Tax=Draconibacterium aestuarii TaxID=2998507 RepID=A0A9X3FIB6_9BACT|nr:hypothetical protein [Prolixibacteraceae bacterium Z1-6]